MAAARPFQLPRGTAGPRSPQLQILLYCAFHVACLDAARLDDFAGRASAWVGTPGAPAVVGQDAACQHAKAFRDRDLKIAVDFVDSISVRNSLQLSHIREILDRFEIIRTRMLGVGASRDVRIRQSIRNVLRDVRKKSDALRLMAADQVAKGQVDDGGDVLPSKRQNVCNLIVHIPTTPEFREQVQLFCAALDAVRASVSAGNFEEVLFFQAAGAHGTISSAQEYHVAGLGWSCDVLLGEERRWVYKQLSRSPEIGTHTLDRLLRCWRTGGWWQPELDTSLVPGKSLNEALYLVQNTSIDNHLTDTIHSLHTRIQRFEFAKMRLTNFVSSSGPAFRERVHDVLRLMKDKSHELQALVAQKEAAGEVDDSAKIVPSERDNICKNLDQVDIEPDFLEEMHKACAAMDKLYAATMAGENTDLVMFEVLGRVTNAKRRPGYWDTPVAGELEILLVDVMGNLPTRQEAEGK